jgi:hypothetical protein
MIAAHGRAQHSGPYQTVLNFYAWGRGAAAVAPPPRTGGEMGDHRISRLPWHQQTPHFEDWFRSLNRFRQALWLANGGPLKGWNSPDPGSPTLGEMIRDYHDRQP